MNQKSYTRIKYVNVKPSATLDNYIQDHIHSLLDRIYIHPNKYSVDITVKANAKSPEAKITSYEVDGTFLISRRANLRARAKMTDVHKAVTAVTKSLEKQIRRLSEKLERSRKTMGTSLKPVNQFKSEVFAEAEEARLTI